MKQLVREQRHGEAIALIDALLASDVPASARPILEADRWQITASSLCRQGLEAENQGRFTEARQRFVEVLGMEKAPASVKAVARSALSHLDAQNPAQLSPR